MIYSTINRDATTTDFVTTLGNTGKNLSSTVNINILLGLREKVLLIF